MYDLFFKKITEKVDFSENEIRTLKDHLTRKKLRKRQYLLQEGDVCKFIAFVERGTLRSYTVDEKGVEHIFQPKQYLRAKLLLQLRGLFLGQCLLHFFGKLFSPL